MEGWLSGYGKGNEVDDKCASSKDVSIQKVSNIANVSKARSMLSLLILRDRASNCERTRR